jgi:hypothetical protein
MNDAERVSSKLTEWTIAAALLFILMAVQGFAA